MDEKERTKTTEDTGEGDKPSSTPTIDEANKAAERMEQATKTQKEENDRLEALQAKQILSGRAEAGQIAEPPKKLTDTEYAEALEKGEVNPLKEDGFI